MQRESQPSNAAPPARRQASGALVDEGLGIAADAPHHAGAH